MERDKPVGILHHKSFSNEECVNFICFGFADTIFAHNRSFDRVEYTHVVVTGNKVSDKAVPSLLFVNLNGFMSSTQSGDMADAKWLSLAMSMLT